MNTFFSALRNNDMAMLDTLLTPNATVNRIDQGRLVSQSSYREALQQNAGALALLQSASVPLENFRVTSLDNAQIEAWITTPVNVGTQTTTVRWFLTRAGTKWRIQRSEEMTSIEEDVGTAP